MTLEADGMLVALDECRNALEEALRRLEAQTAAGPMTALASSVQRLETEVQTLRQRSWWLMGTVAVSSVLIAGLVTALWLRMPSDAVLWRMSWEVVHAVQQQQQQPPAPPAPLTRKPR